MVQKAQVLTRQSIQLSLYYTIFNKPIILSSLPSLRFSYCDKPTLSLHFHAVYVGDEAHENVWGKCFLSVLATFHSPLLEELSSVRSSPMCPETHSLWSYCMTSGHWPCSHTSLDKAASQSWRPDIALFYNTKVNNWSMMRNFSMGYQACMPRHWGLAELFVHRTLVNSLSIWFV